MDGVIERKHFLGFPPKPPQSDVARFGFALANHQKHRDFRQGVFSHFIVNFLVAQIGLDPQSGRLSGCQHASGIGVGVLSDGRDHCLHRRQPEREAAGVMLDQDAEEAFEGS